MLSANAHSIDHLQDNFAVSMLGSADQIEHNIPIADDILKGCGGLIDDLSCPQLR
jgi:hypothetical protein